MTQKTAEQRAEERFPAYNYRDMGDRSRAVQHGYATCIREQVEPLEAWKESAIKVMGKWDKVWTALGNPGKVGESMAASSLAEVVRLRALVQVLVDALGTCGAHVNEDRILVPHFSLYQVKDALAAAKEHGIVPTNTEDNG